MAMMRTTFTLLCTNRFGRQATFDVSCEEMPSDGFSPANWTFLARPQNASPTTDFFELLLHERDGGFARIVMMHNHADPALRGAGIPDALLPEAARRTGRRIQSSPTVGDTPDVRRSPEATKVWQRLVGKGLATFDEQADVFTLL